MDGMNIYISAFLAVYCKSQNELLTNTIAIVISGYIASEIGVMLFNRFKKDETWTFLIIPISKDCGKEIADTLRGNHIEVHTLIGFNYKRNNKKVLNSLAFAKSKEDSNLIYNVCKDKAKCIRLY